MSSEEIPVLVMTTEAVRGHARGLPDLTDVKPLADTGAPPLAESRMLLEGTPDEASENEYVVALGAKIVQHACRMMPMKVKLPNGASKKVPMLVMNEHALAHVLKVFFSGCEVTDEALEWHPDQQKKVETP